MWRSSLLHTGIVWSMVACMVVLAQEETDVSADLLSAYRLTDKARSESDFTRIIDQCAAALGEPTRSSADQRYARQLLAWSSNKRGEVRTDLAAEHVQKNQPEQARVMDEKAAKDFALALQHDPKRWKARHNLAISLAMQARLDEAIEQFSQVIALNPKYANAFFNRGEVHYQKKDYVRAIQDYNQALGLDPNDPEVYSSRAHARFLSEQFDEALDDYRKAASLAPTSVKLVTDYADACQSLFRWQEAVDAYQAALKADSTYIRTLQNASWLMATCPDVRFRSGNGAMDLAKRALNPQTQKDYRMWDILAAAQAASGDYGRALGSAQQALKLAPQEDQEEIQNRVRLFEQRRSYLQPQGSYPPSYPQANKASPPVGTGVR